MAEPSELDKLLGEQLKPGSVKLEDIDPIFAAPPPTAEASAPKPGGEKKAPSAEILKFLEELDPKYYGAALGGYFGPKVQAAVQGAGGMFQPSVVRRATAVDELLREARQSQQLQSLIEASGGAPAQRPMTSGEKWAMNWAGQERPGIGSVPEASAAYQRSKGQGPVTSKMSKMWGPPPPGEPASLVDRLIARSAASEAQTAAQAQAAAQIEQQIAQRVAQTSPLRQVARAVGRPAMGVLGGAGAGLGGVETYQKAQEGDIPGAVISGLGTGAGVASMFAPAAIPVALGLGALGTARDVYRQRLEPNAPITPENIEYASRPAFVGPRMPRRYGLKPDPGKISSALMGELDQQMKQFSQ